jgi:hypothetical protein
MANKSKVAINASDVALAKLLKKQAPMKKAQMGQSMDRGVYDTNTGLDTPTGSGRQVAKKGGSTGNKKWIQKAINPKHKGYCTPMSKPTCTPKRKALAKTLKAMAKKK